MFVLNVSSDGRDAKGYRETYALDASVPLALPHRAVWDGIHIEYHRQPSAECTLRLPEHTICILLSDCFTERRVDGGPCDTITRLAEK